MYKSDNRLLRYQTTSNYKVLLAIILGTTGWIYMIKLALKSTHQTVSNNIH